MIIRAQFKMQRRPHEQRELNFRTWGGRREGAGRKPAAGRINVSHRRRDRHRPWCPVHVTLRARRDVTSLRSEAVFPAVRAALGNATRNAFRVLHFSVQSDHIHLLVEAEGHDSLRLGVQGLAIRVAKAVNRVLFRRGSVWADRFHARILRTPREVRNALVYVLNNVRKHMPWVRGLDPLSSARWFAGWRELVLPLPTSAPVVAGRTWLVRVGWRRYGPIHIDEMPRSRRPGRR